MSEMPSYRKLGNSVINSAHNIGATPVKDTQSGFRCYNRALIENMRFEEAGFGFSTEVLSKARKRGARISQVPIKCIYNCDLSDNSTLNPVIHGFGVLFRTIRWRFWEYTGL
jgi:hypothetical protein